jgi:integrase
LVALRWRDIDWAAGLLRVCRSYTRGTYGKPKSKRSSRAVPLADRIAAELERHFQRSNYQADGTAMAAAGAPHRSLMEWMGHADLKTTLIYADYSPGQAQGAPSPRQPSERAPIRAPI